MTDSLENYLTTNRDDAYLRAEGDPLSVSIGVKFSPDKDGLKINTNFSFTLEKVKETNELIIDENQRGLFGG